MKDVYSKDILVFRLLLIALPITLVIIAFSAFSAFSA